MRTAVRETVSIDIPYASQVYRLNLPSGWLGEIVQPQPTAETPDLNTIIGEALENPIGAPRLEELAQPGQQVVIIVDDFTRPTPLAEMLPFVLERLTRARIPPQDICIVIAGGSHRPMTESEMQEKLGDQVIKHYPIIHSVAGAESSGMIFAGEMPGGCPVWMSRAVKQADLRIGLGMITPHMDAGFSGGTKIILPGVCSQETVDAFHSHPSSYLENSLGNPAAPLRLELEHFVQEHAPVHFLLNLIMAPVGEAVLFTAAVRCVAGDPIVAHRAGIEHSRQACGVHVRRRYPVVVAGCEPYAIDLWQSCKGLWCGDLLTADQGTLIWYTAAPEGKSNYPFLLEYIGMPPESLEVELRQGRTPDRKAAATALAINRMKARLRIILVSSGLGASDAAQMGLSYQPTVEAAINEAVMALPSDQMKKSVAIIPKAGMILPIIQ